MHPIETPLQDITAPEGVCYGCGGSNPHGLHIKSVWHEDGVHVMAEHIPDAKYCGWPDLVYGGLIAMLVDCHSNWTAPAAWCWQGLMLSRLSNRAARWSACVWLVVRCTKRRRSSA